MTRPGRRASGPPRQRGRRARALLLVRPQIGRDYPLNLSISVSGGKENNNDYLSSGE